MDHPSTMTIRPYTTGSSFDGGDADAAINSHLLYALFDRLKIAYDDEKKGIASHGLNPENYCIRIKKQRYDETKPHYVFVFGEGEIDPNDHVTHTYRAKYTDYQSVTNENTGKGEIIQNPGYYVITVQISGRCATEDYAATLAGDVDEFYQDALKKCLPTYAIIFATKPSSRIHYF